MDQADDFHTSVAATLAPIVVLGPASVTGPAHDMQMACERDGEEALGKAEAAFQRAAYKVLKIKG